MREGKWGEREGKKKMTAGTRSVKRKKNHKTLKKRKDALSGDRKGMSEPHSRSTEEEVSGKTQD